MKLTKYSRNLLLQTFALHQVCKDYADPLYNYLVFGFSPGSFWTAVLENNFSRAIQRSHPGNSIGSLKNAVCWINDVCPKDIWGSSESVDKWLHLSDEERRATLEKLKLIYTEKEEVILILKDEPTIEPTLW